MVMGKDDLAKSILPNFYKKNVARWVNKWEITLNCPKLTSKNHI